MAMARLRRCSLPIGWRSVTCVICAGSSCGNETAPEEARSCETVIGSAPADGVSAPNNVNVDRLAEGPR